MFNILIEEIDNNMSVNIEEIVRQSIKNIVNANEEKENKKIGLLLSGGMDSATLAKYVDKNNTIAFTFKYDNNFAEDEYNNAKKYAEIKNSCFGKKWW